MQTELFDVEDETKVNTVFDKKTESVFEKQMDFMTRKHGSDWWKEEHVKRSRRRRKK